MIDVKAIRERADKATPGPWAYYERGCREFGYDLTLPSGIRGAYEQEADADFIVHAREDVPALCDRVDQLEAIEALTRAAYKRGADRFRAAHPEYIERLMWPDTGEMVTWLLERLAEAEAK